MSVKKLRVRLEKIFEIAHSDNQTIRPMEGLRGLAVLLVFFVHYSSLCGPWLSSASVTSKIGQDLAMIGHAGVDLFFVLSGYLIYGSLIRRSTPVVRYLSRRVQRIFPVYLVVFAAYLLLSFVFPSENKIPMPISAGAVYVVQNLLLLPGMLPITPFITVAWSLSYEFFYYLAIPSLISLFALRSWRPDRRIGLFLVLSTAGFAYCGYAGGYIRLLMFCAGILLYEICQRQWIKPFHRLGLVSLGVALAAMVIIARYQLPAYWRYVALFLCFFLLCWEAFTRQGLTSKVFSLAPLRWYGNMSYSYYLMHGLTLKAGFFVLARFLPPQGNASALFWLLLPPMFALTVISSSLLFMLIEKPFSLTRKPARADAAKTLINA